MGLDVSHIQLTLTPSNDLNFFSVDDWDLDCNVPLDNYAKYITTIDDLDFNKTLVIVKNEEQLEKLRKTEMFSSTDYLKVFIGEQNDTMKEQLLKFIVNQKLDRLETLQRDCVHDGIKYHTISFGEPIKFQGVYYTEKIGYQRKGMNSLFYDTFKQYLLWGNRQDFELAYTCVADEWYLENWGQNAVNKMKKNFKENFVDKFEFGKSLLCASF